MHSKWVRLLLLFVILMQFTVPAHAAEPDEYTIFISGFTAFQNQDYKTTVDKMSFFLKEYPSTPMRDMALFWLARAHYRLGNRQEAARYMAQFLRENPDTPLRSSVEDELVALAAGYEKGGAIAVPAEKSPQAPVVAAKPLDVAAPAPAKAAPAGVAVPEKKIEPPVVVAGNGIRHKPGKSVKSKKHDPATSMREKAVSEYRQVMERYPGTKEAEVARDRLRALAAGKASAATESVRAGSQGKPDKSAQVVTLEVGQYASLELIVPPHASSYEVGERVFIPFEVVNRGNDGDVFQLQSGFPAEFSPSFAASSRPDVQITATPRLNSGDKFKGMLNLTIPVTYVDGRKSVYPLRAVSGFDGDVSASRDVSLVSMAPLLRMVLKPDKDQVRPGETVTYRIAMMNLGSAPARGVAFSVAYPPQYEPVEPSANGFRGEGKSVLAADGIGIGSGERKEFSLAFRLKEDTLAGQELFCRAELVNRKLQSREAFLSSVATVGKVSGVSARTASERLTVLPGQRAVIPFTVTNTGNVRESYSLKAVVPSGARFAFLRGVGDSTRGSDKPVSGTIGPLAPREEIAMNLEVYAPVDAADGTEAAIQVAVVPEGDQSAPSTFPVRLRFSRPVVELEMAAKGGRLKPGEISHLVVGVVNRGSAAARDLEVRSVLPERLDVVASEPQPEGTRDGARVWKLSELGPGEKRSIVLSFRVRTDVAAGTNLRIENSVRYGDLQGNSY